MRDTRRGRMGRLWCAAIFVLGLRLPAQAQQPASPQTAQQAQVNRAAWTPIRPVNDRLPDWLKFTIEYRMRWESHSGYGFVRGSNDAYLLSRFRLGVNLRPTPWLEFYVEGQDARPAGVQQAHLSASIKDVFDVRQFWVDLKARNDGPVHARIGRFEMRYGARRLIGSRAWSNSARSFDGVVLGFKRDRAQVDVFAVAPVTNKIDQFDTHRPGENFRGAYGTLHIIPNATLEPYVLWKTLPSTSTASAGRQDADVYTPGFRLSGRIRHFDYDLEIARQTGHSYADRVAAWAGDWIVGYSPADLPWQPRFWMQYACATGDRTPGDGRLNTFDQLYASGHDQHGLADQVGWRNLRHLRVAVQAKPARKFELGAGFNFFWLASRYDGLYGSDGSLIVKPPKAGASHTDIGHEIDCFAAYNVSPAVAFGAGIGHLYTGRFLKENTPGGPVTYPYLMMEYKF